MDKSSQDKKALVLKTNEDIVSSQSQIFNLIPFTLLDTVKSECKPSNNSSSGKDTSSEVSNSRIQTCDKKI